MISISELERMKNMCIEAMNTDEMADLCSVEIHGASPEARMESFLSQVGNPYHFKVGKAQVKISFTPGGEPLRDKLYRHFVSLKSK